MTVAQVGLDDRPDERRHLQPLSASESGECAVRFRIKQHL
jgi:hypothetical protein